MATITTLGEAYQAGWVVRVRCLRGHHRGIAKIDICRFEAKLSMKALSGNLADANGRGMGDR